MHSLHWLRASPMVLSMWACKLKLDEEKSKHASPMVLSMWSCKLKLDEEKSKHASPMVLSMWACKLKLDEEKSKHASPMVLSMWACKLKLDEEKSKHVGLAQQQNGCFPTLVWSQHKNKLHKYLMCRNVGKPQCMYVCVSRLGLYTKNC